MTQMAQQGHSSIFECILYGLQTEADVRLHSLIFNDDYIHCPQDTRRVCRKIFTTNQN